MFTIKFFLSVILSLVFGFGLCYLIFWFITTTQNPFEWYWITKIVYLIFALASTSGMVESITKDE